MDGLTFSLKDQKVEKNKETGGGFSGTVNQMSF